MRLSQLFKDDAGNISSIRVMFLLWGFTVLLVWTITSIKKGEPANLPYEVVGAMLALGGEKVIQKWKEAPRQ